MLESVSYAKHFLIGEGLERNEKRAKRSNRVKVKPNERRQTTDSVPDYQYINVTQKSLRNANHLVD